MWAGMFNMEEDKRRLLQSLRREITDARVLGAMERVSRELFVPALSRHLAYEDIPLPIGEGQTISQPLIVALMTQALMLKGSDRVLEIGTGSGSQTAVLAELTREVVSVERYASLANEARRRLGQCHYTNVQVLQAPADRLGWSEGAPYDAILVTAGAPHIPLDLLHQLGTGGRLVIPVGSRYEQTLTRVIKSDHGLTVHNLGGCRFVPLVGPGAWPEHHYEGEEA